MLQKYPLVDIQVRKIPWDTPELRLFLDRGWEQITIAFCRKSGNVAWSAESISAIELCA